MSGIDDVGCRAIASAQGARNLADEEVEDFEFLDETKNV